MFCNVSARNSRFCGGKKFGVIWAELCEFLGGIERDP